MAGTTDFLAYATGGGANVISQATYAAASYVTAGRGSGILPSNVYNKIARQGNFVAAGLAQYVANVLNINVADDGNLANFIANLTAALALASGTRPARIVTSSAALSILAASDYAIALNRTAAVAAMAVTLDPATSIGQEFVLEDVQGNLAPPNQATVSFAGGTINKNPNYVMAENFMSVKFRYYGSNIWSASAS
jgi:hypothetical protein